MSRLAIPPFVSSFSSFLAALPLLLGACSAATPLEGGQGAPPPSGEREGALLVADDDHPCGDVPVAADVTVANGNRLQMCVLPSGVEAFIETGPIGRGSAVKTMAPARPACGLELLVAVTGDDVPVPRALVDACTDLGIADAALATRLVVDAPVITWLGDVAGGSERTPRANYCGSGGAASFQSNECFHCAPYDDCADWCVTALWGYHDRTLGGVMGEEGNVGIETTAACTGQVHVRAQYAEDTGDAWSTKVSKVLNAGTSSTYGLIYHSVAIFGQDYDIRLRAESFSGGGVHRHSGYFLDE